MAQRLFIENHPGVLEGGNELALMKISNHAFEEAGHCAGLSGTMR